MGSLCLDGQYFSLGLNFTVHWVLSFGGPPNLSNGPHAADVMLLLGIFRIFASIVRTFKVFVSLLLFVRAGMCQNEAALPQGL